MVAWWWLIVAVVAGAGGYYLYDKFFGEVKATTEDWLQKASSAEKALIDNIKRRK